MNRFDLISTILKEVEAFIQPGVTGMDIERLVDRRIAEGRATSYNKGYKHKNLKEPYPFVTCISPNFILAHGFPTDVPFKDGDIVTVDLSLVKDGLCADAAFTVGVGEIENKNRHLIKYAKGVIFEIAAEIKAGVTLKHLAETAERYVGLHNFVVNRNFTGHAIGKDMHEKPLIPNTLEGFTEKYREEFKVTTLPAGMIVCIETVITFKDKFGLQLPNGWEWSTRDGKAGAMFEHMIEVLPGGYKILTTHF